MLPWPADMLPAESVKLGTETDKVRAVLAVREPEVPVTVTVYCPTGTVLLAVSVITLELLVAEVGFGAKDAVTPLGRPVTARLTLPANPFCPNT